MLNYYCIATCDKCRLARKILREKSIDHVEIDLRKDGLNKDHLENWIAKFGIETLLNKRSTTWKSLSESEQSQDIVALILSNPAMLHRPIIEVDGALKLGKQALDYLAQI